MVTQPPCGRKMPGPCRGLPVADVLDDVLHGALGLGVAGHALLLSLIHIYTLKDADL